MLKTVSLSIKSAFIALSTLIIAPLSAKAAPASADTILRWLPPGTVEIRCINGPVSVPKYDSAKPPDPYAITLLEFVRGPARGNIGHFLNEPGKRTSGCLAGKTISTSVRGSQVLELTATDLKSYSNVDPSSKTDCWPDVDIVEFEEPIREELTAELLSRPLKQSMIGANQVWQAQSSSFPRNLHLYLTIPDDHTVMVSSSTSPALLLAAVQRMKARATSCVIPANHIGWSYLDRQSDYWFFNAYPAAHKNLGSSAEPQGLDEFARSALAVVAQYRPAKTATLQFAYISTSPNALALLKQRLDLNFVTPRVRFTARTNKIIQFDYQPIKSPMQDFSLLYAALYSMVGHEVH